MSVSFAALAIMGADYLKDGMSIEEFERHEAEVPPYLLADEKEEENEENFFSRKINIQHESSPTKNSDEFPFCSQDLNRCENDNEGEQKKTLDRSQIFLELLKKKDVASFFRLVGIVIVSNLSFCTLIV
ncbi:hypothetical protein A4A49_25890 [Nicotiana attenuata]|uniref:Uncharacterized protein n=1 Tax=Nicotiana attenuata TaxID=49451 RepID=A0A1J6K861_NICAT|nr:hypothetical protein A4A49_25890 [Nicotiana attenuata]